VPSTQEPKELVARLVNEVINGSETAVLSEICTPPVADALGRAFDEFRRAFPDWRMEIVRMVSEPNVIAVRFRCTGTQLGEWLDAGPSGRSMRIDEVYFFDITDGRLSGVWALEDTWTRMQQLAGPHD
jgi:predicted ester cyclase